MPAQPGIAKPTSAPTRLAADAKRIKNMNSVLTIRWLLRPGESNVGRFGGSKTERRHQDFLVDGQSLHALLDAKSYDLIGVLGWADPNIDLETIASLTLKPPSSSGIHRYPIFVCAECGDLGCGAITAAIEHQDNTVVWSDFAYENDYDPSMTDRETFKDTGPFTFDSHEYVQTLEGALKQRNPNRRQHVDSGQQDPDA